MREADARTRDAAARLRVQTVFDCPLVLRAGAGTGKTSTLVARVVAWCLGEGWRRAELRTEASAEGRSGANEAIARDVLSRVAAITFTEAAAGEMAERISAALCNVVEGRQVEGFDLARVPVPSEANLRARARALHEAIDHLTVRTIHAFCRSLLGRFPLEAGFHPAFEVDADERSQGAIVREVMEEALRDPDPGSFVGLLALGVAPVEVEEVLRELVRTGAPVDLFSADPLASDRVDHAGEALLGALFELAELCNADFASLTGVADEVLQALELTRQRLAGLSGAARESVGRVAKELAELWSERLSKRLGEWAKGRFNRGEEKALGARAPAFQRAVRELHPCLRSFVQLDVVRLDEARAALDPLWRRTCERLRARGVVPFSGLLAGARDLLRHHPAVCVALRSELDQLLVDEFQDTDRLQCEIIREIALAGPPRSRPGLFLVGDPKQSIYGWRSADLRAYDAFIEEVEAQGGELLDLTVNFRSVPAVLDEVERLMGPVMQRERGLQPEFQALVACPALAGEEGFRKGGREGVEHWVSWGWDSEEQQPDPELRAAQRAQLEAVALARDLRELHDEHGLRFGDAAVLLRDLGDLDVYLAELRARGIPYAVERDRSYYRRREIIDATALVRSVLDPNDMLALVTWLRSPSVGVPDAAWIPLFSAGFPGRVRELLTPVSATSPERAEESQDSLEEIVDRVAQGLPNTLPGAERIRGWEFSLKAALEGLAAARSSFVADPADRFVSRLRDLSAIEVTEASRYLGAYRAANLDRFFRDLSHALCEGTSPQEVLRALRTDVAESRDAEEEKPATSTADTVRVMTIHRAKGLDFPHVYLLQVHKSNAMRPAPATEIFERASGCEYALLGTATLGCEPLRLEQKRVEAAERVRTLYVAATRAKRRLVLAGARSTRAPSEPDVAKSHADLIAHRMQGAQPDLAVKMSELARADEQGWRDEQGVLWRFPALDLTSRERPSSPAPAASGAAEGELQLACAAAERLAHESDSAEQRMGLPWHLAASAALHTTATGIRDRSGQGSPVVAAAAGTLVHRVLETLDLTGLAGASDLQQDLERRRARLAEWLDPSLPSVQRKDVLERAEAVLTRFAEGPLLERLNSLSARVVARELPVLLPPTPGTAVGFISGTLDMVYREAGGRNGGSFVVVDYKTDRIEEAEVLERAKSYEVQGRAYTQALQQALALADPPRFELWFLWPSTVLGGPG